MIRMIAPTNGIRSSSIHQAPRRIVKPTNGLRQTAGNVARSKIVLMIGDPTIHLPILPLVNAPIVKNRNHTRILNGKSCPRNSRNLRKAQFDRVVEAHERPLARHPPIVPKACSRATSSDID